MPLRIVIPAETTFDDATQKFTDRAERVLTLEHSLLSMALWEAEYKQCFSTAKLDPEMFRFYISCMTDEILSDEELRVIERLYKNKIVSYMFDDRYAKKTTPSKSPSQGPQSRQSGNRTDSSADIFQQRNSIMLCLREGYPLRVKDGTSVASPISLKCIQHMIPSKRERKAKSPCPPTSIEEWQKSIGVD